jgi:hypothetical protein
MSGQLLFCHMPKERKTHIVDILHTQSLRMFGIISVSGGEQCHHRTGQHKERQKDAALRYPAESVEERHGSRRE